MGPKINQNCFEERSEDDFRFKSFLGPPKSANASCAGHQFGYYLGDLRRRFAHRWAPRASRIKRFNTSDAPKPQNMTSRMRQQKKFEISIELCPENASFRMCSISRNALYKGISVVGADYDKIKKFIKTLPKWTPKVIPKSTLGRSGVRLFRF